MRDVAAAAGVSIGTVSYALTKPSRVGAATLARVLAVVDEMGFVPNSAARSMKAGGSTGLGIVVGDIRHSFSTAVARGAGDAARAAGSTLLIANGNGNLGEQSRYVELFDEARMEGVIIESSFNSKADIDKLHEHHRRVVTVNHRSSLADTCSVLMDNDDAGYQAAHHLIELGMQRLAFVTRTPGLQPLEDRQMGIERAIRDAGLPGALRVIATVGIVEDDGRQAARAVAALAEPERPDGVIVGTALAAKGFVAELESSGISVPSDIRLVCTEVNALAEGDHVSFTTVAEPAFEMGMQAVGLALVELAEDEAVHVHRQVILRARLVVGASSLGARPAVA